MKATELRIGNMVKKYFTEYGYSKICEIDITDFSDILNNVIKVEPIPLSEDWLLKFGLKITDNDYEGGYDFTEYKGRLWENIILQTEDIFYYFIHIDQDSFYSHTIIEIKYVHQLQNLYFDLTNEELTIK